MKLENMKLENMTTEEKALEIANRNQAEYTAPWGDFASFSECEKSALEMAEWKDQQLKKYLEKKKLECVMNAKQVFGYDMGGAYDWELKAHFCDEIINELFKKE